MANLDNDREQINALVGRLRNITEGLSKIRDSNLNPTAILDVLESRVKEAKGTLEEISNRFTSFWSATKGMKEGFEKQAEKFRTVLQAARDQIQALKEEADKLSAPPSTYGIFSALNEDGTAIVYAGGRKMKVNLHPAIDAKLLCKGQEVILNDAFNVVEAANFEIQGEVVRLKNRLDEARAIVTLHADEERAAELSEPLRREKLHPGDHLLFDPRSGYLLEKLPKIEVEDLILEEVPDISYADIGGLDSQIEMIRDAIELPYLYADLFREHKLLPPKGVLLYGPPGCGKTLVAKAVANSLAKRLEQQTGVPTKSYFLNIKGPELLNKYVGETERKIREIFQRARDKASEGMPVVIFFDELDSLLRTRGSGISSDVESTIVPQFLAEIDGVEGLKNVIVIGASNRQDLIDPAVLRPGRFDVKIKIDRPDQNASKEIFSKYLIPDLPLLESEIQTREGDRAAVVRAYIEAVVEDLFLTTDERRFLEVTYQNNEKEVLYFKDFVSGAMIQNIVTRAKKAAVKRLIATGVKGIIFEDFCRPCGTSLKKMRIFPIRPTRTTGLKLRAVRKNELSTFALSSTVLGANPARWKQ